MPGIHLEVRSGNKSILAKTMLIRSTLELAQASKVNICIAKIPGYSHTEAFRELSERIEAECMRQEIPCSISNNWQIEADINFVLGAHLEPEKYRNLDTNQTILINLERLASLKKNETITLNYFSNTAISTSAAKTVNIADKGTFDNQFISTGPGSKKHGPERRMKSIRNGTPVSSVQ